MWFLVLYMANISLAIIPEKYPTEEACHNAANGNGAVGFARWNHSCIPAPVDDPYYNCQMFVTDPSNPGRGMVAKTHCEPSVSGKGNKESK